MKKKSLSSMTPDKLKSIIYARGYYAGKKNTTKPLTDKAIMKLVDPNMTLVEFARRIEQEHNIKTKRVKE